MKKHTGMLALAVIVVLLLLTMTSAFTTDSEETVLVQTFGETTRVSSGDPDAGLHFKWPWPFQRITEYDTRTQLFRDTLENVSIKGGYVNVTTYCAWRVEDPTKFQREVSTMTVAEARIRDQLRAEKQNVFGQHEMADLVNTDPARIRLGAIEDEIMKRIAAYARNQYGVGILMVGVCELGLPQGVSASVIENMKERVKEQIGAYESGGKAEAEAIRSRAEQARKLILDFAMYKAGLIKSEGEKYRARVLAEFGANNELARFIRTIDRIKSGALNNSRLLLDANVLEELRWNYNGNFRSSRC